MLLTCTEATMKKIFSSLMIVPALLSTTVPSSARAQAGATATSEAPRPVPVAPKDGGKGDAAADAEAERAKKERDARTPVVVEEAAREKVETADTPALDYEDFRRQQETKVAAKRKELLATLDEILKAGV